MQRRAGGLLEAHVEFVGDDGGQRGLAQAWRAEEEHVVEGLAAGFGGFQGDGELLLGFGLADELAQPARTQFELKALFFVGARGADQPFRSVVARDSHAGRSVAAGGGRGQRAAVGGARSRPRPLAWHGQMLEPPGNRILTLLILFAGELFYGPGVERQV